LPEEIANCIPYLVEEIRIMDRLQVIVALGRIAFDNTLRIYRQQGHSISKLGFAHAAVHKMGENLPWMVVSYHPSRQNTQTGRLTEAMFMDVWEKVRRLISPEK
jgi:uracil-DNA glycosylase family 4